MTQEPKAQIMHYMCQIRKKAYSAHFFRYLRKNYVKPVTDVVSNGAACGLRTLSEIPPTLPGPPDSMVSFEVIEPASAIKSFRTSGSAYCAAATC